jgi:hypothetical protein
MTTTRSKRLASGILVGAGATALTGTMLFAGVSSAHDTTGTDGAAVAAATTPTTMADQAQRTLVAADAGTVTVQRQGDVLSVIATDPVDGFTATVKQAAGQNVKVWFSSADTIVSVRAHLTDSGRFRYSVTENEDPEAMRARFIAAVQAQQAADQAAATQAAAERAAAEKAAAARAAEADDDGTFEDRGFDGKDCDHDGFRGSGFDGRDGFRQASFDDDGHDGFHHRGGRGGFDHGGPGRR